MSTDTNNPPPVDDARVTKCSFCRGAKRVRIDLPRDLWIPMKDGIYEVLDGDTHECVRGVSQAIIKPCPMCTAPSPTADEARTKIKNLRDIANSFACGDCEATDLLGVPVSVDIAFRESADMIERLISSIPSEEATDAEEVIEQTFVQSWDQHIGQDGAIAIVNELRKRGYAITRAPGAGT